MSARPLCGPTGAHAGEPARRSLRRAAPRRAPRRRRPARAPAPVVVDVLAGLAGLGFGVTLALGGRRGERRLVAGAAAASRPRSGAAPGSSPPTRWSWSCCSSRASRPLERAVGQDRLVRWHRRLGPWPLYLLVRARRADHRRLRAGRARRRPAPARAAAVDLPGRARRDRRRRRADRRRRDLLPARAAPHGVRDLVVGAPLHVSRAVPVVLAPGRHGCGVRRPPGDARSGGRCCGRGRWPRSSPPASGCRCGARCATACGSPLSFPRGRTRSRSCSQAADWIAFRSPAASSCSGASCAAGCGGRRIRTRSRRFRAVTACGSPSRTSATTAAASPRSARARASRSKGPTACSRSDARRRDRLLLIGAGRRQRAARALLEDLPKRVDVVVLARASAEDRCSRDETSAPRARRGGRLHRARRPA